MANALFRRLRCSSAVGALISPYAILGFEPPLVLDFDENFYRTGGTATDLVSAATHTRAGNATMVDSDGVLKWAPHNLLTYSEQFEQWGTPATVEDNSAVAPDGTTTAAKITTFVGFANQGVFLQSAAFTWNNQTGAFYVKAGTTSIVSVCSVVNQVRAYFDIGNETVGNTLNCTASITPVGDGWYRCECVSTSTGSGGYYAIVVEEALRSVNPWNGYVGTGKHLFIWGAHLYRSDLGGMVNNPVRGDSYVQTTSAAVYLPRVGHHIYNGSAWVDEGYFHESEARTNLLTYSSDFTQWTNYGSSDSIASGVASPDGSENATSVIEDTATSGHGVYSLISGSASPYTASVFVKANTANYVSIRISTDNDNKQYAIVVDLSDGSVTDTRSTGSPVSTSHSVQDVGNGWYKISATATNTSSNVYHNISVSNSATPTWTAKSTPTYTGDGTSGVYLWGAQLEAASTMSSYIPTSGATATRAAETLTIPAANLPWPEPVVIGEEEVSDPSLWVGSANWSVNTETGTATVVSASSSGDDLNIGLLVTSSLQEQYLIEFTVESISGGSVSISGSRLSTGTIIQVTSPGTYSYVVNPTITGGGSLLVNISAGGVSTVVSNISVREINPLAVSIQMDGTMTYADEGVAAQQYFTRWYKDGNNQIFARFSTDGANTGEVNFWQINAGTVDFRDSSGTAYSPGINVPFNIASRHGSTFINGAVDGTALTANLTPTALPNLSATNMQIGSTFMGTIKLFRVWADDLTDAGIEEASV